MVHPNPNSWEGAARSLAASLLAVLTVLASGTLLIALTAPASRVARLVDLALPVPDVAALDYALDMRTAAMSPEDARGALPRAVADAGREAAAAPLQPKGWLDLSYATALLKGWMDPSSTGYLERSFVVSPINRDVGPWRTGFVLANWRRLGPELRKNALAELRTLYREDPLRRESLVRAVEQCRDPFGRAQGELALAEAGWKP